MPHGVTLLCVCVGGCVCGCVCVTLHTLPLFDCTKAIMPSHVCIGSSDDSFPWASQSQQLAQEAGNCSLLTSISDAYHSNYANDAGGVMFSTNTTTSALSCDASMPISSKLMACPPPLWSNNSVSRDTSAASGYGAGVASAPASIVLDVPPMTSYVSNGNVKLPMAIYVMDQGGSNVTSGEAQGPNMLPCDFSAAYLAIADAQFECMWA